MSNTENTVATIYGDATIRVMPADEDGDIALRIYTVAGAPLGGNHWTREAAEFALASMHTHYVAEQSRKPVASRAAQYLAGNERIVGAGPEER